MKIVYIAGKYSGASLDEVYKHVELAHKTALEFARKKIGFLCPIIHTAYFDRFLHDMDPGYDFWMSMTMELLKRSDAVFCLTNWQFSRGARAEVAYAEAHNMPIFDNMMNLEAWYGRLEG